MDEYTKRCEQAPYLKAIARIEAGRKAREADGFAAQRAEIIEANFDRSNETRGRRTRNRVVD
jgi:hypothetical protein